MGTTELAAKSTMDKSISLPQKVRICTPEAVSFASLFSRSQKYCIEIPIEYPGAAPQRSLVSQLSECAGLRAISDQLNDFTLNVYRTHLNGIYIRFSISFAEGIYRSLCCHMSMRDCSVNN